MDLPVPADLVEIGVIVRPHGVRGAVKVLLHNADTPLVARGRQLLLRGVPVRLLEVQALPDPRFRIVHLEGVADCDAAEALRREPLCVRHADLPKLGPGEYYHVEIIGARVEDPSGHLIGTVEGILTTNLDVLEIRRPDGSEVLIPVRDPFVVSIDRVGRKVVAVEPEWA
jgi:16S rRNA processing protein RimM